MLTESRSGTHHAYNVKVRHSCSHSPGQMLTMLTQSRTDAHPAHTVQVRHSPCLQSRSDTHHAYRIQVRYSPCLQSPGQKLSMLTESRSDTHHAYSPGHIFTMVAKSRTDTDPANTVQDTYSPCSQSPGQTLTMFIEKQHAVQKYGCFHQWRQAET